MMIVIMMNKLMIMNQVLTEVTLEVEIPPIKEKDQLDDDHDHEEKINDNDLGAH